MAMTSPAKLRRFAACLALTLFLAAHASSAPHAPSQSAHAETAFWQAFNRCDLTALGQLLAPQLEFYHDREGALVGANRVTQNLADNLCAGGNPLLRREVVGGSQSIHAIPGYGTLVVGKHAFYARDGHGGETSAGTARFSHLWEQHEDGVRLARVLSFDHRHPGSVRDVVPPPSSSELAAYSGAYLSARTGTIDIAAVDGHLQVSSGDFSARLIAVAKHQFRAAQAPLQFSFQLNEQGQISGFELFENGQPVDAARRL